MAAVDRPLARHRALMVRSLQTSLSLQRDNRSVMLSPSTLAAFSFSAVPPGLGPFSPAQRVNQVATQTGQPAVPLRTPALPSEPGAKLPGQALPRGSLLDLTV